MAKDSRINEVNEKDAKMAAIMSHYVYFYMDWLEYVLFHAGGLQKYYNDKKTSVKNDFDKAFMPIKLQSTENGLPSNGNEKVKSRIVSRLREISNITGKTDQEASKIIIEVLEECKKRMYPLDLYELYDKFGYWTKVRDIKEEALKWHVSHPYEVYKCFLNPNKSVSHPFINKFRDFIDSKTREQDICLIYRNDTLVYQDGQPIIYEDINSVEQDELKQYSEIKVFNTVLTHGMDRASGYGAALFTKIDKGIPTAFAYCTKGTDVNSVNDWVLEDILQGLTGIAPQYIHNLKNTITVDKKVQEIGPDMKLFFCGHSLGGGLASAGAVASKERHAITFNAAGLNFIGSTLTKTANFFFQSNPQAYKHPYDRVHPIRIDGEAIDLVMLISKLILLGINERGYGSAPLILKLNDKMFLDVSESGGKHGINNFLCPTLLKEITIVTRRTVKNAIKKDGIERILLSHLGGDIQFESTESTPIKELKQKLGDKWGEVCEKVKEQVGLN